VDEARRPLVILKSAAPVPTVAVDYDDTIVNAAGEPLPGAREALSHIKRAGWRIIVWTGNEDPDGVRANLERRGIPFDYINENPEEDARRPSRKVFFHATVDNKAVPFDGNWPRAVAALDAGLQDLRRAGLAKSGVRLMGLDESGEPRVLAEFRVEGGRAVEKTGARLSDVAEILGAGAGPPDGMMERTDGPAFLEALLGVQGTYLWAEVL